MCVLGYFLPPPRRDFTIDLYPLFSRLRCKNNYRPFYQYGGHIEFIRFKEYYGIPRGHSLTIYAGFSGKKRTSMHISRKKGDRYCSQRRHNDLFFSLHFFLGKLKERLARKARVNMRSCSRPPGHPIILLKSN